MHLALPFPPSWLVEDVRGLRVATVPGYKMTPDLFFEVGPLVPRRTLDGAERVARGVPAGSEIRRAPVERTTTTTGWPIALHAATLHDPDGTLRELRLLARYEITVLAAAVLVRATNAARFEHHRANIGELLAAARPELACDEPAAISELWDLATSPRPR